MKSKAVSGTMLTLLFIGMLALASNIQTVKADETHISVDPSESTVMVGNTILISITLAEVVDLYAWQVVLYFDPTVLCCTGAWLPPDHVFTSKTIMPLGPVIDTDDNGTYVAYGCVLLGDETTFTGSGTLCQISFTGMAEGSSALTFGPHLYSTILLDSNLVDMSFEMTDGSVTVVQPPPVGGKSTPINIPMNKPETPTLWIWLTTITLSLAVTVVYVKKRKRELK